MPKAQNRAGKGSIILWRRFTFPIFLLFIYGWELIVERYILIPEQLNYVEIYVVHCTVYTVYSLQKVTINRFVACRWYPNKLSCCCSDAKKCRVTTLPTVPSPHRAGALGFFSSSNIKLDTMRLPLLFFLAVNLLIFHNHATSSFSCRRHLSPPPPPPPTHQTQHVNKVWRSSSRRRNYFVKFAISIASTYLRND